MTILDLRKWRNILNSLSVEFFCSCLLINFFILLGLLEFVLESFIQSIEKVSNSSRKTRDW